MRVYYDRDADINLIMDKKMVDKNQGCETHQTFYCGTNIFFFKLLLPIVKIFLKKNNQFTYCRFGPGCEYEY